MLFQSAYWGTPFEELHFFHLLLSSPPGATTMVQAASLAQAMEVPMAGPNGVACGQPGAFLGVSRGER
jgi:hypothetical protein